MAKIFSSSASANSGKSHLPDEEPTGAQTLNGATNSFAVTDSYELKQCEDLSDWMSVSTSPQSAEPSEYVKVSPPKSQGANNFSPEVATTQLTFQADETNTLSSADSSTQSELPPKTSKPEHTKKEVAEVSASLVDKTQVSDKLRSMYQKLCAIEQQNLKCDAMQAALKGLIDTGDASQVTLEAVRRKVMLTVYPDRYQSEPDISFAHKAHGLFEKLYQTANPQKGEVKADFIFSKEEFIDAFKSAHEYSFPHSAYRQRNIVEPLFIEQVLKDEEGDPIELEAAIAKKPKLQKLANRAYLPIVIENIPAEDRAFMTEVVAAKEDAQGRVWVSFDRYFENYEDFLLHLCITHGSKVSVIDESQTMKYSAALEIFLKEYPGGANCCEMWRDPSQRGKSYVHESALMKAVSLDDPLEAFKLLEAGANPEETVSRPEYKYMTGIIHAVRSKDMLKMLLKHSPHLDINKQDSQGSTLLHILAHQQYCGQSRFTRFAGQQLCHLSEALLDHHARVDLVDNKGNTAFHLACLDRNLTMVLDLLFSPKDRTELALVLNKPAAALREARILDFYHLVELPQQLRPKETEAEAVSLQSLKAHIAQLPFLSLQNYDGQTPLMAAVQGGSTEILTVLLGAGLDPYAKDSRGYNVFQAAIYEILSKTTRRNYQESKLLHDTTRWILSKMIEADPSMLERQLKEMLTMPISRASGFRILEPKVKQHMVTLWNYLGGKKKWNGSDYEADEKEEQNSCKAIALTQAHFSTELLTNISSYMRLSETAIEVVEAAKSESEKLKLRELLSASQRLTNTQQRLAITVAPIAESIKPVQEARRTVKRELDKITKKSFWSSKLTDFEEAVNKLKKNDPDKIAEWAEHYSKRDQQ
ncbi:ankyrin repeat domain-containing protein [Parashewanella curva]|nr:ankyrin repeat domain-containing protein [Parashewanella curva]